VSPGAVFGLDDPHVRIKAHLPHQIGLGLRIGRRHCFHGWAEGAIDRMLLIERCLRGRPINVRSAVKAIDLNENRSCFFGTTSANCREHTFDVAAPHIGRNP